MDDPEVQTFNAAVKQAQNPRLLEKPLRDHFTPAGLVLLGMGAFGAVFRATHVGADKRLEQVAVKLIYSGNTSEELVFEVSMLLFLRAVNNNACRPNLICYVDNFSVAANAANRTYLQQMLTKNKPAVSARKMQALEVALFGPQVKTWYCIETTFRPGSDMQTLITDRGGKPPPKTDSVAKTARLMRTAAGALAFMHQHRAAHRDIKPSNVQVVNYNSASDAECVLLDVGLACHWGPQHSVISDGCKNTAGTDAYMPPGTRGIEKKLFDDNAPRHAEIYTPDERMSLDVYALGATFYEWLSGGIFHNSGVPMQDRKGRFGELWGVVETMYTGQVFSWPKSAVIHDYLRRIELAAIAAKK